MELTSLIARVAAAPNDEAAWRVLGDVLLESGDPRGEYLALSMKATQSSTVKKRLAKLFERHRQAWLGPLFPRLAPMHVRDDGERWERGFPVRLACMLDGSTVGAREWLTVRELVVVDPGVEGALPLELKPETTPHLRAIFPYAARWSPREGLVLAPRWPGFVRKYLESIGREALLEVPSAFWFEPR